MPALYVCSCTYNAFRIQAKFDSIAVGTSEADLIELMGQPNEFDSDTTVNSRYASRACEAPCTRRAWYYNRLQPLGLEAWSFELDKDGRVIESAHWVSP